MASPADADAPAPALRGADSGWGTKIAAGAVAFLLVVEFVLPGFVAAGFSRTGSARIISMDHIAWIGLPAVSPPPVVRAEMGFLAPANWLMYKSDSIRRFYMWQYQLAGGEDMDILSLISTD